VLLFFYAEKSIIFLFRWITWPYKVCNYNYNALGLILIVFLHVIDNKWLVLWGRFYNSRLKLLQGLAMCWSETSGTWKLWWPRAQRWQNNWARDTRSTCWLIPWQAAILSLVQLASDLWLIQSNSDKSCHKPYSNSLPPSSLSPPHQSLMA